MAEKATTTKEKNEDIYKVENVYARVEGGNDQITFDAKLNGKKIPVTTVNHNNLILFLINQMKLMQNQLNNFNWRTKWQQ